MSDDQSYAQDMVSQYPLILIENYCIVATSALLWFDYVLTFSSEYRRIWRRRFTGATLIFLLMRYAALIERVYFVLEILVWNASNREYDIVHAYLATAAFITFRVYGIWGREWKPLVLAVPVSFYSALALAYESARYTPVQGGPPFGCVEFSYVPDIVLYIYSWKAGFSTPLATFLLRDGTVYFLVLVTCQVLPFITISVSRDLPTASTSADTVFLVWPYFGQVLIVIIHSRFMLDLRGIYFADSGNEESELPSHWSGINFRGVSSIVVGNLGATLDTTPGSAPNPQDSSAAPQDSTDGECESEWEDETPKYCNDPFATGMKDSGSSNVAQGATQDSETAGIETPAIEQSLV
ncbi:hypothetical protein VTO73DRAFT_12749 [Trametes versicolor]